MNAEQNTGLQEIQLATAEQQLQLQAAVLWITPDNLFAIISHPEFAGLSCRMNFKQRVSRKKHKQQKVQIVSCVEHFHCTPTCTYGTVRTANI